MMTRLPRLGVLAAVVVTSLSLADQPQPAEPSGKMTMVDAVCVEVPRDFLDAAGLTGESSGGAAVTGPWTLTAREAKMLDSLLRARPGVKMVSRPKLMMRDNQAAQVAVGQDVPVGVVERKGGTPTKKVVYIPVGVGMNVTPKVSKDGKFVCLDINAEHSRLLPAPPAKPTGGEEQAEAGTDLPNIESRNVSAKVCLPDRGTAVIACPSGDHITLWVLTARLSWSEPKVATFAMQHLTATDAAKAVTAAFAKEAGEMTVCPEPITNKLLVQATPAMLKRVAKVVEAIDAPRE